MSIVNDALKKAARAKNQSKKQNTSTAQREEQWIFQSGDPQRRRVVLLVGLGAVLAAGLYLIWSSGRGDSPAGETAVLAPGEVITGSAASPSDSGEKAGAPQSPRIAAHYGKGLEHYQAGRLAEAEKEFAAVLALEPESPTALNNLGLVYHGQGRMQEAISSYLAAIKLDPNFAEAMNNLGLAYDQQGRAEEAVALYDRALRIKPNYPEAHLNYAIILERMGYLPEAKKHYQSFLSRVPPHLDDVVVSVKARLPHL